VSDTIFADYLHANGWLHYAGAAVGAAIVVGLGKMMQARGRAQAA
jgi:hypothetical protein